MALKCVLLLVLAFLAQLSHSFVVVAPRTAPMASRSVLMARSAAPPSDMELRKAQCVAEIAEKSGLNKTQAEAALAAFTEVVMDGVSDGKKVILQGFGTFEPRSRAARKGRNPRTGEELDIKASTSPAFSASKPFKDQVKAGHQ